MVLTKLLIFSSYLFAALPPAADFASLQLVNPSAQKHVSATKKLVYFWATWCPDCKYKLKTSLNDLAANKQVDIMAINIDAASERLNHFIKKEKLSVPIYTDPEKKWAQAYQVSAVPRWLVFTQAANGEWKEVASGQGSDWSNIQSALTK